MLTDALVVSEPGAPFELQQVELHDDLRPDEVAVRIKATGVCHTDLNFSKEKSMPELFPAVLGHEGAGIVERIGSSVTKVSPGDHVIVCYTCCGKCKYCLRKETAYCDLWFQYNFGVGRLDGSKTFSGTADGKLITSHFFGQSSFAKNILVSENGLVKVDKHTLFERLAPLGCGLMTGAGAMLNAIRPTSDMSVAVVGAGAVGLAAIMALKTLDQPPSKIIAVDIVAHRLEMARTFGATHGVNSKEQPELKKVLMEITDGRGVDGAIDTTGRPEVVTELIRSAARRGKVVTVGVGEVCRIRPSKRLNTDKVQLAFGVGFGKYV
ncbi:hypothetical protein LTR10_017905 [Elasticomyces elasticus]|uniref:Enoyl reductase (ER) domain-containing protein n=1 Tax=Exophiala sideris TaxID=1016849 RepID=A0ABR0IWD4_9EURO|nr:hypothetical protein LTR10_017905 [Elasticomyces elasticus]KAK5021804.1 hypothetical protein LTS07_010699 [Exophiala sideris]KAK5025837.1 hypothetical protein LTR13_010301 [Exophiala sideris]KAK5050201.1 hypothetical protein LTR69_010689 [Exophiala sideris]KAK5177041.1 hypothetical protein LTR44_010478 [Eurotiomycetes sp. CCFEE 6388]